MGNKDPGGNCPSHQDPDQFPQTNLLILSQESNKIKAKGVAGGVSLSPPACLALQDLKRTQVEREAYAEFLQTFKWESFFTVTFRKPRKEPYYAMQSVFHTLERECSVSRAFMGVEPHQSGDLHIHGLAAGFRLEGSQFPNGVFENPIADPRDMFSTLFKVYGRSKVEACRDQGRVSNYCAKYILKQQSRCADFYEFFGTKKAWECGRI